MKIIQISTAKDNLKYIEKICFRSSWNCCMCGYENNTKWNNTKVIREQYEMLWNELRSICVLETKLQAWKKLLCSWFEIFENLAQFRENVVCYIYYILCIVEHFGNNTKSYIYYIYTDVFYIYRWNTYKHKEFQLKYIVSI